ncbi:MAG: hypothetical protein AAGG80_01940 [Pseudomonadota bacterium]
MKIKIILMILVSMLLGCLTACSMTYNQNRFMNKVVSEYKLKNGRTFKVGYQPPAAALQCKQLHRSSQTWTLEQFKGMVNLGGGYERLRNTAIAYANKHPRVNFAYVYIPDQTSVLGINFTALRESHITYYHCKKLPATTKGFLNRFR